MIALGLLLTLVFFSYSFGRVGSPGRVLFVVSTPGVLVSTIVRWRLADFALLSAPVGQAGLVGRLSALVSEVLPPLARITYRNYPMCLLLGLGLMVVAVVGDFIRRLTR